MRKVFIIFLSLFATWIYAEILSNYKYAVVISKAAYSDAGWKSVADTLLKKHSLKGGKVELFQWTSAVTELKQKLKEFQPDYIGFIVQPVSECNSKFLVTVSQMCRALDEDPYGDAIYGIITGYNSADALRAVKETLLVKTVLAASENLLYEPPIRRFYQAIGMTCDSYTKTDYLFPNKGGKIYTEEKRPEGETDRIKIVSKWLNAQEINIEISGQGTIKGPIDCIITGGHGNVNLWQCHYPDAGTEGYLRSSDGKLFGDPYSGSSIPINSPTPKIFWCLSNCLMGNPDNINNIVYAAFHTGHAVQMFGFINNASAGNEFMAWGVYDRVTKMAGTLTLAEAFFISNNNAMFEILNKSGFVNVSRVKIYMDSAAFYGDPAGDVTFYDVGDSARAYRNEISINKGNSEFAEFTFTFTMNAHNLEAGEGYCYQFRPIKILPVRIDPSTVVITTNEGYKAEITDNLVIWEILAKGETLRKGETRKLRWSAKIIDNKTNIQCKESIERNHRENVFKYTINRNRNLITIQTFEKIKEIAIYDLSGKIIYRKEPNNSYFQIPILKGTKIFGFETEKGTLYKVFH